MPESKANFKLVKKGGTGGGDRGVDQRSHHQSSWGKKAVKLTPGGGSS